MGTLLFFFLFRRFARSLLLLSSCMTVFSPVPCFFLSSGQKSLHAWRSPSFAHLSFICRQKVPFCPVKLALLPCETCCFKRQNLLFAKASRIFFLLLIARFFLIYLLFSPLPDVYVPEATIPILVERRTDGLLSSIAQWQFASKIHEENFWLPLLTEDGLPTDKLSFLPADCAFVHFSGSMKLIEYQYRHDKLK